MTDIDPVKFGEMIQVMRTLEQSVTSLDNRIVKLDNRLDVVELRFKLGKMGLFSLAVGLGFAIFGFKETLLVLWGKLT